MVSIHIDIKTRILPDDHRAFVVRPGSGYRLYNEVRDQSVILYDLPGLEYPDHVEFLDIEDLTGQIQRSQALRWWLKVGQHAGDDHPSLDLNDYPAPTNRTARRSLAQLRSIGRAYFERSRVGDLVIVPPLKFSDPVLVGEITDAVRVVTTIAAYGDLPIYGRRVKWLAEIPKKDIPSRVVEISQKPNSFVQLERSTAVWFYDRTYRSYVLDGRYQCELKVAADNFGSSDDIKLTAFLNFVVANLKNLETGGARQSLSNSIFAQLGEYEPNKRVSINSPGEIIVYALRRSPIIFAVLLTLAGCAPPDVIAAASDQLITIGNSAAGPGDPCAAAVYASTVDWLNFVGADMWAEACPIAQDALNSASISAPTTATVTP